VDSVENSMPGDSSLNASRPDAVHTSRDQAYAVQYCCFTGRLVRIYYRSVPSRSLAILPMDSRASTK
jgi:hypothetical protein